MEVVDVAFPHVQDQRRSHDEQQISNTLFLTGLDEIDSASLIALSFILSTKCLPGLLMAWSSWKSLLELRPERYTTCLAASMNPVRLGTSVSLHTVENKD